MKIQVKKVSDGWMYKVGSSISLYAYPSRDSAVAAAERAIKMASASKRLENEDGWEDA